MRGTILGCLSVLWALVVVTTTGCSSAGRARKSEGGKMAYRYEHRATGRTQVETYVPTTFDELADGPALMDIQVTETFTGDIEGEGTVRVIQAARQDGSATFVGIERVRGSIAGRRGTFLLQVSGTVMGKKMRAEWFVVPGAGTGELTGLRGDGGFEAQLGQQGSVWLDYAFQ